MGRKIELGGVPLDDWDERRVQIADDAFDDWLDDQADGESHYSIGGCGEFHSIEPMKGGRKPWK